MVSERKNFAFIVLVALLALALGACSGTLPTELPADFELEVEGGVEELEFSGAIEEMGADSWTVAGISFFVNNSTEIQPGLELGDVVKVHAQMNTAEELTAREIEAENDKEAESLDDDEFDDETEFTGAVEAMGADNWIIGGTTVAISSSTEIKGNLQVGDLAKVHASMVDGVLTAREIEPAEQDDLEDDNDENEFFGVLESMNGDVWVVGGTSVAITPSTEIKGNLQVGDIVKVHASMVNGLLTAREIEPANEADFDDDDDEDDEEFIGLVEAISGDTWTVGGRTFTVSAATEIKDSIQVGDLVKVEMDTDSSGNVYVEEIELANDDDLDDDSDDDFDDDHDDEFDDDDDDEDDHHDDDDHEEDRSGSSHDDDERDDD